MPRPPSNGQVTERYGPRDVAPTPTSPLFHYGEDRVGSGNVAPVSGQVVFAGYYGSYGNIFGIRETANPDVIWWVAHNANLNDIAAGIWRAEGQYVAPLGSTGNVTGPHSHTERRVGGAAIPGSGAHTDPSLYYTNSAGIPGSATPSIREKEISMIGFEYVNPGHANHGVRVLADPVSMTCGYRYGAEYQAYIDNGGSFKQLVDTEWRDIVGRYRQIDRPDPLPGDIDEEALGKVIAAHMPAGSDADAIAATRTAILEAIGAIPKAPTTFVAKV